MYSYWCTCWYMDEDFPKHMLGTFGAARMNGETEHVRERAREGLESKLQTPKAVALE